MKFPAKLNLLFSRGDPITRRLNWLRVIYQKDPSAGLHTRRVRNVLRGKVAPEYQTHYDRLLRIETASADLLSRDLLRGAATPDLLSHVYALTERTVRLIEQLQRSDKLISMYLEGSKEQVMVIEARQRILAQIDTVMALQESIPARLLQLSTASSGRDMGRIRETLADLDSRLEGMAATYDDLRLQGGGYYYDYDKEPK
jgi:hypothetical protein